MIFEGGESYSKFIFLQQRLESGIALKGSKMTSLFRPIIARSRF